jgi:hypothetical protein
MSKLNDIFDIQLEETPEIPKGEVVKKSRKKPELSDEKKAAMLERLRAGREKRAENLSKKKNPEVKEIVKEENNQRYEVKATKKELPKVDAEAEKLSFINMMAGKNRDNNPNKYERPKKKVYDQKNEEPKVEAPKVEEPKVEAPKMAPKIEAPKMAPKIEAPKIIITPPVKPQPVVISFLKKPMWA